MSLNGPSPPLAFAPLSQRFPSSDMAPSCAAMSPLLATPMPTPTRKCSRLTPIPTPFSSSRVVVPSRPIPVSTRNIARTRALAVPSSVHPPVVVALALPQPPRARLDSLSSRRNTSSSTSPLLRRAATPSSSSAPSAMPKTPITTCMPRLPCPFPSPFPYTSPQARPPLRRVSLEHPGV